MGKGSRRRPCDEVKVRKNWPFPSYGNQTAKRLDNLKNGLTEDGGRKRKKNGAK